MARATIGIISPAAPQSNSGNSRTAARWARMLAGDFTVRVLPRWRGEPLDLMIALHARRSAASIAGWAAARAGPLAVVLTGTDLYRDIRCDDDAQRSLRLADALVVLQAQGMADLPAAVRGKATVIYQSAPARAPLARTGRHLRALLVGHLRAEKSPQTLFEAARLLRERADIRIDVVGGSLDPALAAAARRTARDCPAFRWLGAQPHPATLRRIQRAHLLVNCSTMEGGAHVVLEAARCGTPVLASRIAGNLGMLGPGYRGYFPPQDAGGLAALIARCREEPRMLAALARQCRARSVLFEPRRERQALVRLAKRLLGGAAAS